MADLELDISDSIATLTMNRPEARNALSMDMRAELDEALHEIEFDDAVRCVVLTGAGEHFMAGGDLSMASRAQKPSSKVLKRALVQYLVLWWAC